MSSSPNSSSSSDVRPGLEQLAWLGDVPCPIEFVLGTATIKVRDCLELREQRVIKLVQSAGSDLEVRANGIAIAMGEVVMTDESTGLRLSRVLSPSHVGGA